MPNPTHFDLAFNLVIGDEGGYVNDPQDPGGETNYGIAKRFHPDEDIKNMSLERAKEIYLEQYWKPLKIDLVGWPVAYVYFDAAVNMGVGRATELMQEALGEVPDRIIGPRTTRALIAQGKSMELVINFQAERGLYYAERGHFDRFGRGWLRRVIRGSIAAATGGEHA